MESLQRFRVQSDETESDPSFGEDKQLRPNMSFASLDMSTNNALLSEPSTPTILNAHENSIVTDSSLEISTESQSASNNDTNYIQTTTIRRNESTQSVSQLANGNLKASQSQSNAVHAYLSMPCRNLSQLKTLVPYLVDHTIISVEERVSKRLTTKYKVCFYN